MSGTGYRTLWGMTWRLLVAGTLVFSLAGAAAWMAVYRSVRTEEATAPSLVALPLPEAVREASRGGFAVRISEEETSTVLPPGRVLSQRPAPGDNVKAGTIIQVRIARAP